DEIKQYQEFLDGLVRKYTGKVATAMMVDPFPVWSELEFVPASILVKVREVGCSMSVDKWKSLTTLQRFALVKLSREGHESKNFPIALKEFALL
ncbi:MAG: nitrate reductase associated protein, partial [Chitinophagaceae bacterium]